MKATQQYFPVEGEIVLCKVFLMKFLSASIQTKATEQYFPVVQFIFW